MQAPHVILFDLDGTLMDNTDIVVQVYTEGMKALGYSPKPKEFIETLGGMSTFATGRALGLEEKDLPLLDQFFWDEFGKHAQTIKDPNVFPCVREFLRKAKETGMLLGVVTSNRKRNTEILLEKAGLRSYFSVVVGSDAPVEPKPSREPIDYALQELSYVPKSSRKKDVWFVGDSKTDVQAAHNAGVTMVSIPASNHLVEIQQLKPDYLFMSFSEFFEFLFGVNCKE